MSNEVSKDLSQQMLRWQIAEQETAVQRNRVAVLEMVERKRNNDANIFAAKGYIQQIEAKLKEQSTPLERQKLLAARAQQHSTIERQVLENMEGAERANGYDEAIVAALKTKREYEQQLNDLEQAHGRMTDEQYQALRKGLNDG